MNTWDRIKQKFEQMSEEEKIEFFERQNEISQTDQKYRNAVFSQKGMESAKYLCGQTDSSDEELRSFEDMANAGNKMVMYDIAAAYYHCQEYFRTVEDNSKKAFWALVMANLWVAEAQAADPEYMEKQKEKEQQKIQELKTIRERIAKYQNCIVVTAYEFDKHLAGHTVGLKTDGTVVAVGWNGSEQCKTNDWRNIVAISASHGHTVGLKANGTVVAVGDDKVYGQCKTQEWNGWKDIVAVFAVANLTIGVKSDGTAVVAGKTYEDSFSFKLDINDWQNIVAISSHFSYQSRDDISLGVRNVVGLKSDGTVVAIGADYKGSCKKTRNWRDIVAISVGKGFHQYTVGLKSDGTVVAVGDNDLTGQCNTESWRDIVAITTGFAHTVGLRSDGTVVSTADTHVHSTKKWKDIVAISAGYGHTVGLKADGTVVTTGNNEYNACDTDDWSDIVAISAGANHTVGLKTDGTVVATGRNKFGECNTDNWQDIGPVPEELLLKWKQWREQGKCQSCGGELSGGKCKSCNPGGCYVATCVYGSYDCPEVWTLRRFRDNTLNRSWFGKMFIQMYYAVSPKIVKAFGAKRWFNFIGKPVVDKIVAKLQNNGFDSSPYADY